MDPSLRFTLTFPPQWPIVVASIPSREARDRNVPQGRSCSAWQQRAWESCFWSGGCGQHLPQPTGTSGQTRGGRPSSPSSLRCPRHPAHNRRLPPSLPPSLFRSRPRCCVGKVHHPNPAACRSPRRSSPLLRPAWLPSLFPNRPLREHGFLDPRPTPSKPRSPSTTMPSMADPSTVSVGHRLLPPSAHSR